MMDVMRAVGDRSSRSRGTGHRRALCSSRVFLRIPLFAAIMMLPLSLAAQPRIERVSVTERGHVILDGKSDSPSVSGDGRFVAFVSNADLTGERNGIVESNVFVRDRERLPGAPGSIERISVALVGGEPNGDSSSPSISADGRIVAFSSRASNLVADDANGMEDVFVRDRTTGVTERISVGLNGGNADGASTLPDVSADGRFVVFQSQATNLLDTEDTPISDIFLYDRETGTTTRISVSPTGDGGNGPSITPSISGDGRVVAFVSSATNLVDGDTNGVPDVFVRWLDSNTTDRASVNSDGVQANGISFFPTLSFDGWLVAFKSDAFNLVENDTNGVTDVFVRDRAAGTTERVSVDDFGNQSNGLSGPPSMSGDACDVAFPSAATNLVVDDGNGQMDVFVVDRCDRNPTKIERIGAFLGKNGPNGSVPDFPPSVSQNGQWVAFASTATDLIPGEDDPNPELDVFITGNPLNPPPTESTPTPTNTRPSATPTHTPTLTPTPCQSEQCPPGQVCDPATNTCVNATPTPTPTPCQSEQCPPGQVCDPATNMCVNATPTPTPTPCRNEQCPPGQVCDPETNMCANATPTPTRTFECTTNEDCPPGEVCDPETHMCVTPTPGGGGGGGGGCNCEINPNAPRNDIANVLAIAFPAAILWLRRRARLRRR